MAGYEPVKMRYVFRIGAKGDYQKKLDELVSEVLARDGALVKKEVREAWYKELTKQEKFNKKPSVVKDTIMNYMVYKTVKMCVNYRDFGVMMGLRRPDDEELKSFDEKLRKKILFADLPEGFGHNIVDRVLKEREPSHITLKLHQMLEYIKRDLFEAADPKKITDKKNPLGIKQKKDLKAFLNKNLLYDNANRFEGKNRNRYESYDEVFLITPPAIFEWEILFRKKGSPEGEDLIKIDDMSSGEKQLMHSFSYILYHIKNLQSVKDTNLHVPYHHVSLIFDEAELYYHPEFQRDFIAKIIKMLAWCHIDARRIRSVNINVVTHSPFVLSDVMEEHTLNMNQGMVKRKDKQTFGANIHELLYDQFIDDSIGAVVRKAVDTVVRMYGDKNSEERKHFGEDEGYYYYLASTIAEPYIRENLLEMLAQMSAEARGKNHIENLMREREQVMRRLRELDREIEEQKNK